ncbi:MAG TPA: type II toxin-antitoxin system YoeB family toxin [Streptosporangiaceae bacterium]|nr:type II toxin-antitoxin system YoeB family toxin [Streptosporangiaceae bacterium]
MPWPSAYHGKRHGKGSPERPAPNGMQPHGWPASRRITDEHRLICKISENEIRIAACRYHYGS